LTARASRARQRDARIDASDYDAGKKIKGKKRHAIVDILGLMLSVSITSVSFLDRRLSAAAEGGAPSVRVREAAVRRLGYNGDTAGVAVKRAGEVELEIAKRFDVAKGFMVLPKRWIVERTSECLGRC